MKRLIKRNNHVGPVVREDVLQNVLDSERTMRRNSSDSYLIARQLVMDTTLTPTNENMILIMNDIDSGKYSDLGKSKDNWDKWLIRTEELFREKKIIISKKKRK